LLIAFWAAKVQIFLQKTKQISVFFALFRAFYCFIEYLFVPSQPESSVPVCRWCSAEHERKVRAAQDTPLVKVPAVGDSWSREKKITARKGKGEKVG